MGDFDGEEGVGDGEIDGESEAFVPDRASGAGVVCFGGESAVRFDPEGDIGFEISLSPVAVVEMFCGENCDVEIEKL